MCMMTIDVYYREVNVKQIVLYLLDLYRNAKENRM